jgi:hypothetical protein
MKPQVSILLLALCSACNDYGVNIIELPDPHPPDTEVPGDSERFDSGPPLDTDAAPTCSDGPWPEGEASVDETCRWEPETGTFRPVVEWWMSSFEEYPGFASTTVTPAVGQLTDDDGDGDIDSDDTPDIAAVFYEELDNRHETVLRLISGDGSAVHWSVKGAELGGETWHPYQNANCSLADIAGDGSAEIATTLSDGSTCRAGLFDNEGTLLWVSTEVALKCGNNAPAFADLEGDGVVELVYGPYIFDAASGALLGAGSHGTGCNQGYSWGGYHSVPADMDGDGIQEIVAGRSVYRPDGEHHCFADFEDGYAAVADLDGDGLGEFVITGAGDVRLFEHDCWFIGGWSLDDEGMGGPATIADYDGDGQPEIGIASYGHYTVYETDGSQLWRNDVQDHSSSSTGSSVYDFDGDGYAEVVYADEEDLWIFQGIDGAVRMRDATHWSWTANEYPVIVDVDGDGEVEIVVSDLEGIFVVGDQDHSWVAGRQVWNQASYNIVNVNDDLTIPAVPDPSWPGHNNFRSGDISPAFGAAAPDAVPLLVDVCTLECDAGILQVTLQVGNSGLEALEAGIEIALWDGTEPTGDPLAIASTASAIPSGGGGDSLVFELDVSTTSPDALTIVVDPSDASSECSEDNNTLLIQEGLCP